LQIENYKIGPAFVRGPIVSSLAIADKKVPDARRYADESRCPWPFLSDAGFHAAAGAPSYKDADQGGEHNPQKDVWLIAEDGEKDERGGPSYNGADTPIPNFPKSHKGLLPML
jgi:hypothetical protein